MLPKQSGRIIVIAMIAVLVFLFKGNIRQILQVIEIPLVRSGTWVTKHIGFIQDVDNLSQDEIQNLLEQKIQYATLESQFKILEKEHEELKKTLGFIDGRNFRPIGSSILSRTTSNGQSRLVLNRGSNDGVIVGAPVIVEDGLFVGKVVKVSSSESIVSTVTDRDHATAVSLLNKTETIGMIKGLNGNLTVLGFIPLDEVVEVDDLVVTSGLEEHVPSGLLVGFVNTARPDPNGPFQEAIVEPIVDIRRFTNVIILLPFEI